MKELRIVVNVAVEGTVEEGITMMITETTTEIIIMIIITITTITEIIITMEED